MSNLAVKIAVIESERGWGCKIDDWMVCLTNKGALDFKEEFNSENTSDVTPDWYMQCEGEPEPIDLTDEQYKYLQDNGRTWLSDLKKN